MKYGVREICDVVLKAKATQKVGNKTFFKNEPVIYFDTLKTSSLEGAATTVYAQGGRGNTRLMAWEGERTVTFTMEDALISPAGFMILSGAGLVEASTGSSIKIHVTEQTDKVEVDDTSNTVKIRLNQKPYWAYKTKTGSTEFESYLTDENWIYVMLLKDGEVVSEPYIPDFTSLTAEITEKIDTTDKSKYYEITLKDDDDLTEFEDGSTVLVDYYTEKTSGAFQIEITPDKFGGNYYLEASTLFRDTNGVDKPAEFIIPNCKIQSNFNFTMASSGDPSSFNFTMDAFPDYTRFDKTKKVLAAIQVVDDTGSDGDDELSRDKTASAVTYNEATGEFEMPESNVTNP